ncbi:MAG: 50S ribosomal protein L25/general stress protein Ctc [Oceanospirillaceae bacterium]|nr:50S ribosomal protein L25/general stress protein Ctc [Oceanospirillaceae bacterium]
MSISLNAEARDDLGKGASRRLRRLTGGTPAIVFGGAKNRKPQSVTLVHKDLWKASETEGFYSSVITLNIGGKEEPVIVKDIQRHPAKNEIQHVDFLRVTKSNLINILVPLRFVNEATAPAIKIQGGKVSHAKSEVEITCLAANLPECLTVDMQDVPVGGIVHLADIVLPKGVSIRALRLGNDHNQAIATITGSKGA